MILTKILKKLVMHLLSGKPAVRIPNLVYGAATIFNTDLKLGCADLLFYKNVLFTAKWK